MNQQIKQIAERLKGLREALDIELAEIATLCGLSEESYLQIESGNQDIPISLLHQISQRYNMELSVLMFGNEAHMDSYYLTRAGKGPAVERTKAYKYQALGAGFKGREVNPLLVTVEPDEQKPLTLNRHSGQEFNFVLKGTMLFHINGKELILHTGDSIYFNSALPHGMKALNDEQLQFLAVVI